MSSLILEIPVSTDLIEGRLVVRLGNGVQLITPIPDWTGKIYNAKIQIVLDVEGSPPDANTRETSVE